jgi:hypothetical protein
LYCYLRTLDNLHNCLYRINICIRTKSSLHRLSLFIEGSAFFCLNNGIITYGPVERNA